MNDVQVLEIAVSALTVAAKLSGPILVATLVIGVVVSVLQTITQVQEQSLTFVPKLMGVALLLVVGGHWMIRELVTWVTQLWNGIPAIVG